MRKLFFVLLLCVVAVSSAQAQFAAAPEGAVMPNGAFHYMAPGNVPVIAWGGQLPWNMHFPVAQAYPLSYPYVPVPMPPPSGSTSDSIRPMPDAEDKTSSLR
ncbi:MAG TPA: hypothetical protein VK463_20550 [Desulfomonilaceae bacterium]|nr:hypothetical protein [Desulfomonilaceae bacterium]